MSRAYYNEIDPYCVEWLKNLISAGHIPAGDVDNRSIEDVRPSDLGGYTQCHFFAGIGGWAYAARLAGIPDDEPIWTGSCPCQPFSQAGKGIGFADERHLWPAWFHLISQCKPSRIFGEQVAAPLINPWIDLVQDDLEALGYAFGAVPFPAAGVGAPHIRDRLYWVADSDGGKQSGLAVVRGAERNRQDAGRAQGFGELESCGDVCGLANTTSSGSGAGLCNREQAEQRRNVSSDRSSNGRVANPDLPVTEQLAGQRTRPDEAPGTGPSGKPDGRGELREGLSGPTNGFWRDADWLLCRDGKWRPVEPGTFPLAHGVPARVGKLRAYGNAIVPQEAAEFIKAVRAKA